MTRGRPSKSKLSQRSQKEQKTPSLVAARKPTPRRSSRGAPEEVEKLSKKDLKALAKLSQKKSSQEAKAPAQTDRKVMTKPKNQQNFFIQRISRRNKSKESVDKQMSDDSSPRSKADKKNAAGKSSQKEVGKKTPRSTRGRPARDEDQESEENVAAPSTQKVEQISDSVAVNEVKDSRKMQKLSKQSSSTQKPERAGRQSSKKKLSGGQLTLEETISKPSTNLKSASKRKNQKEDVVMAEPVEINKQKSKEKAQKANVTVKDTVPTKSDAK